MYSTMLFLRESFLYPDKSTHHSQCAQSELEIYWQKVDMTASCYQFVQQAELCQCLCIARLN